MKIQILLFLSLVLSVSAAYCQDENVNAIKEQILNEGLFLFRLEQASWQSTDVLVKDHSNLLSQVNGYLSYPEGDDTRTIFWNEEAKIIFSVTFDSNAALKKDEVQSTPRPPSEKEAELIKLRNNAFDLLTKNIDKFFTFYENTSPNLIPIISNSERTVFILTGSRANKLLIGNDYKLSFNDKNEIITKAKLHKSLIPLDQGSHEQNEAGSMHTHVLKDQPFMTSTDICTFMLYMDVFKLQRHVVVSDKGTSIFESDKRRLIIVPQNNSKKK